ncbi:MAG: hypothetical protein R3313_04855, partial [Candidatus Saccharimonadales bacterium]|nr:hypothetical protein [Candidatus Saccharimonadales bacterium]
VELDVLAETDSTDWESGYNGENRDEDRARAAKIKAHLFKIFNIDRDNDDDEGSSGSAQPTAYENFMNPNGGDGSVQDGTEQSGPEANQPADGDPETDRPEVLVSIKERWMAIRERAGQARQTSRKWFLEKTLGNRLLYRFVHEQAGRATLVGTAVNLGAVATIGLVGVSMYKRYGAEALDYVYNLSDSWDLNELFTSENGVPPVEPTALEPLPELEVPASPADAPGGTFDQTFFGSESSGQDAVEVAGAVEGQEFSGEEPAGGAEDSVIGGEENDSADVPAGGESDAAANEQADADTQNESEPDAFQLPTDPAEIFDGTLDKNEWVSHSYENFGQELGLEGDMLEQFTTEAGELITKKNPDFDFTNMQPNRDYSGMFDLLTEDEIQRILENIGYTG